ncbi:hypothetical protein SBOR_6246 [Sclerotinia borealis F-4128]|uniref:Uncharacterized protein n=1 Tax=Sclerotinia borealis (strain F-4128) TaxID=1432307 RepID=W9CF28_SCLBF|nr:hypothetical protein SBOR_6246 [Sclerotinia borealis F-4128]
MSSSSNSIAAKPDDSRPGMTAEVIKILSKFKPQALSLEESRDRHVEDKAERLRLRLLLRQNAAEDEEKIRSLQELSIPSLSYGWQEKDSSGFQDFFLSTMEGLMLTWSITRWESRSAMPPGFFSSVATYMTLECLRNRERFPNYPMSSRVTNYQVYMKWRNLKRSKGGESTIDRLWDTAIRIKQLSKPENL